MSPTSTTTVSNASTGWNSPCGQSSWRCLLAAAAALHAAAPFERVGKFAPGASFAMPVSVATDSDMNVYVLDRGDYAVKVFDPAGKPLRELKLGDKLIPLAVKLAVAPDGKRFYITDFSLNAVVALDADGRLLNRFGGKGSIAGRFHYPSGLCLGANGDVYVADQLNSRIQAFTPAGKFLREFSTGPDRRVHVSACCLLDGRRLYAALTNTGFNPVPVACFGPDGGLSTLPRPKAMKGVSCLARLSPDLLLAGTTDAWLHLLASDGTARASFDAKGMLGVIADLAPGKDDTVLVVDKYNHCVVILRRR